MSHSKSVCLLCATVFCVSLSAVDAGAQSRGGRGPSVGHAAPRPGGPGGVAPRGGFLGSRFIGPRIITPRIIGFAPYRPYYYGYRPGLTIGFYSGFGFGYPYAYGYPYPAYGYGYPYGYPYGSYGYSLPPAGYMSAARGAVYGGVRIQGAPRDAQVFADGYYVGVAEDFDGPVQHLNLEAGVHKIEIRAAGLQPVEFDVNVQPGQTVSVHADVR
jgi:PEGA domain-containing protein